MDNELRKYRIMFNAGKKLIETHPDDNEYDEIHFERALNKVKKIDDLSVKRNVLIDFITKLNLGYRCEIVTAKEVDDYLNQLKP